MCKKMVFTSWKISFPKLTPTKAFTLAVTSKQKSFRHLPLLLIMKPTAGNWWFALVARAGVDSVLIL